MVCKNINFKTVSLNVRGIRSFEKWKAVINWLHKSQADICFLQETYSTLEVVNMWKKQWKDDTFFSQGTCSCHSKGTMILVKEHLDFKLISSKIDSLGRYIFLEVDIQDSPFVFWNIYVPNKCAEQGAFFSKLSEELKDFVIDDDKSFVIGGDFNVILDPDLDGRGGNKKMGFPALADDSRKICEGKLRYSECFSVVGTFPKNKRPGNDGLTIEFYLAFWSLFGRLLVDSLDYAFELGELSNS